MLYKHPLTIRDPQQKPQFPAVLDYTNPLTKGLVGCYLMNEEGGNKVFNIAGEALSPHLVESSGLSRFEDGIRISSTGSLTSTHSEINYGNKVTFAIRMKFPSDDPQNETKFFGSGDAAGRFLFCQQSLANYKVWLWLNGSYTYYFYPGDTTSWFTLVITSDGAASGVTRFYLDGKYLGQESSPSTSDFIAPANTLAVGPPWNQYNNPLPIKFIYFWNRILQLGEITSFYTNPYQFIIPANWFPDYYVPAAAPAGLSIPVAMHHYKMLRGI